MYAKKNGENYSLGRTEQRYALIRIHILGVNEGYVFFDM